ncbi:hypothetical protein EV363DRAFT_1166941, partial [Boletus edulis]
TAGGDRATWAVDGFLNREAMDLHLKGQLDRTMSTNNFAEVRTSFLPLAERLSRSACNRNQREAVYSLSSESANVFS